MAGLRSILLLTLLNLGSQTTGIQIQQGGTVIGSAGVVDLETGGGGIGWSCNPDSTNKRVVCTAFVNTAVAVSRTTLQNGACTFVDSHTGTQGIYTATLVSQCTALLAYQAGQIFLFRADASNATGPNTIQIDTAPRVGIVSSNGTLLTAGSIQPGVPYWIFYDGSEFRLL
jgi:hypothetical protein